MGVALVIIHFRLGFSRTIQQAWGTSMTMETTKWKFQCENHSNFWENMKTYNEPKGSKSMLLAGTIIELDRDFQIQLTQKVDPPILGWLSFALINGCW